MKTYDEAFEAISEDASKEEIFDAGFNAGLDAGYLNGLEEGKDEGRLGGFKKGVDEGHREVARDIQAIFEEWHDLTELHAQEILTAIKNLAEGLK